MNKLNRRLAGTLLGVLIGGTVSAGLAQDAAGFEVVERDAGFIKFTAVPGGFWLLVARRP